jgi:hypothetical protein
MMISLLRAGTCVLIAMYLTSSLATLGKDTEYCHINT